MDDFVFYDGGGPDLFAGIAAREAGNAAQRVKTELGYSKVDIERLLMITEALWVILKEQHGYEDEELVRRIQEIDMRDGKLDGRVAATAPVKCPKCHNAVHKKRLKCIYCGTVVEPELFAR